MVNRIALGVIIWVVVALICLFVGPLLETAGAPPIDVIGGFLATWAWLIGFLAGAWFFFTRGGIVL